MKTNKNYISFAVILTLFCPIQSTNVEPSSNHSMTHQEEYGQIQVIDLQDAYRLVKNFAENLKHGHQFMISNTHYVITPEYKNLSQAEISLITTVLSDVVNAAIETISEEIQEAIKHPISQDDAQKLLQALSKNLTPGSVFTLNGTTYTIVASR